jgi:hypothetical protein
MKIIKIKLDHKKDGLAVFKTDDQKQVTVPLEYIPSDVKEESVLYLKIQNKLTDNEGNQKEVAKAILEEILNGG